VGVAQIDQRGPLGCVDLDDAAEIRLGDYLYRGAQDIT
jgi:hypothetical protein